MVQGQLIINLDDLQVVHPNYVSLVKEQLINDEANSNEKGCIGPWEDLQCIAIFVCGALLVRLNCQLPGNLRHGHECISTCQGMDCKLGMAAGARTRNRQPTPAQSSFKLASRRAVYLGHRLVAPVYHERLAPHVPLPDKVWPGAAEVVAGVALQVDFARGWPP